MRVAQTDSVCVPSVETSVVADHVLRSSAKGLALGPHDERSTLPLLDVESSMSALAGVKHAATFDVLVLVVVLPVGIRIEHATKCEVAAFKVLMGCNGKVEGHVALIYVHVEVLVPVRLIEDDEGVVVI
eukprot:CAMPEP_0178379982 /NCGR_PEP_ID=MMETSP0689_2-20121128/5225_1 /TAXON_ID=160604 /ORGANISM="Amphidinium massartii, Strain CS-259" /LENGTH=128 /DNA_ID=CAMNT_0020000105 /DNA_START=220 /DNA_END=606 /DNA_ORIENTATION=+